MWKFALRSLSPTEYDHTVVALVTFDQAHAAVQVVTAALQRLHEIQPIERQ